MPSKYDPETRAKAVRLMVEHREDDQSELAAITAVSKRLGMTAKTLRNWIRQHQVDDGQRDGISSDAAAEIRALKRRNAELEQTNPSRGNKFLRAGERQPPLTTSVCEFIASRRDRFGVAPICRVLTAHGVPIVPRTFHACVQRAPSKRALWDATITEILAGYYEPDEHGRRKPESGPDYTCPRRGATGGVWGAFIWHRRGGQG